MRKRLTVSVIYKAFSVSSMKFFPFLFVFLFGMLNFAP